MEGFWVQFHLMKFEMFIKVETCIALVDLVNEELEGHLFIHYECLARHQTEILFVLASSD